MENLGKLAEEYITGFEGIITRECTYLGGYGEYLLTPTLDSDEKEEKWFPKSRVRELKNKKSRIM